jgi:hypothetical protein
LKIIIDTLNEYKGDLVIDLKKYAEPIADDIVFFAPLAAAGYPEGAKAMKHLMLQAVALLDIEGIEANDQIAQTLVKIAETTFKTIFTLLVAFLKTPI